MLATFGFVTTGLLFGVFAYTFNSLVIKSAGLKLKQFAYAYYSLGLALLVWGIASAINDQKLLEQSVIIGNCLILLGTLFMIDVWVKAKNRSLVWGLGAIVAAALVYFRVQEYSPEPVIQDGVLLFNTQRPVAAVLGLIFLLIWLPVNIKVARLVAQAIKQESLASIYVMIYSVATASALVFMSARRVATVILSFAAIAVSFAMLVGSNVVVKKLKDQHGSK